VAAGDRNAVAQPAAGVNSCQRAVVFDALGDDAQAEIVSESVVERTIIASRCRRW
jgi:hypothetical protein